MIDRRIFVRANDHDFLVRTLTVEEADLIERYTSKYGKTVEEHLNFIMSVKFMFEPFQGDKTIDEINKYLDEHIQYLTQKEKDDMLYEDLEL